MSRKSESAYGVYCIALFVPLALCVVVINLFVPSLRGRRVIARRFSRLFLRLIGIPFSVVGLERLPAMPCVVVANHSSYLDGVVVVAALPPDFAFVIKREMARVPVVNLLLSRLGSQFVERFDRHQGAIDARRVSKLAARGQSIVFFPEGTFTGSRLIGKFHGGAFATAARNGIPIVAVAVSGTRDAMPHDSFLMRRVPIKVEVLATLSTAPQDNLSMSDIRQRAREMIASAVAEDMVN